MGGAGHGRRGAIFVSGVATAPAEQGKGHAAAVCRFLVGVLPAEQGRVALMVHSWNHAAIRLYERLGLRHRPMAAAHVA
ncbi:GNAT family N-acetyltransferase [Sphaerisporangium sp. NPDC051017]|uniref:GNAT family N-acetyltransferase n=1 Tax=Sphaerisporangium sp. NPDC051017 TaxID=3154636 RepID=UPI00341AA082